MRRTMTCWLLSTGLLSSVVAWAQGTPAPVAPAAPPVSHPTTTLVLATAGAALLAIIAGLIFRPRPAEKTASVTEDKA